MRSPQRLFVFGCASVLVCISVIALGRWEEQHSARVEVARMQRVLTAVGPLATAQVTGYRIDNPRCLAYSTPENRFGLQLCFDPVGRLVETVDRRGAQPVYASLNYQPSLSTIRFPIGFVNRLFLRAIG